MATALITIEGVLASSRTLSEPIVNSQPIAEGLALYHALKSVHRIVLFTAEGEGGPVEHWCMSQGLTEHALLAVTPHCRDLEDATAAHVRQQRSGASVSLLVTPSPAVATATMRLGVTTLLFLPPNYMRPEFRPDHEKALRQWDAIDREITAQRLLKANDARLQQ